MHILFRNEGQVYIEVPSDTFKVCISLCKLCRCAFIHSAKIFGILCVGLWPLCIQMLLAVLQLFLSKACLKQGSLGEKVAA